MMDADPERRAVANKGAIPKLTPETAAKILKAVAAGNPLKFAAESSGVSESTVMKWLSKGRKAKATIYVQFVHDIKKAQADSVRLRVGRITKAGRRTWQANAWWLERMQPDHFGTDKRLVASLLEQVTALKAQLDAVNADAGRDRTRGQKAKPRRRQGDPPPSPPG